MGNTEFQKKAIEIVREYIKKHLDKLDNVKMKDVDVYVVWLSKILRNNKALISSSLFDGIYYEVTFNGEKNEFYLDAYKKFENVTIINIEKVSKAETRKSLFGK